MILNRDFKLSVWFLILILNDFVVMISILILKSFCAWFMILNDQNLPANHQILQVALQAAEQQLLIYFTDCSCSQSYLILGCFYQNSFRETSCTVCRSCHPCCVVWTLISAVCSTTIFLFLKPKMWFLLQSLTQHISWNGCRLSDNRSEVSQAFVEALLWNSL